MTDVENSNGRLRPRRKKSYSQTTKNLGKTEAKQEEISKEDISIPSSSEKTKDSPLSDKSPLTPSFLCLYCDRRFHSKKALSKHVQRIHHGSTRNVFTIKCQFCSHVETDRNHYIYHMLETHPTQFFACTTCSRRFPSFGDVQEHTKTACLPTRQTQEDNYRNKLRHKNISISTIHSQKADVPKFNLNPTNSLIHPRLNDVVVSCELNINKDDIDFEESISMNLILPSCKNLCPDNVHEKRAVIVLDDIQWKRKHTNLNSLQRHDDTDQILSRLGVVHRSRGTETSRYWYRHVDESSKFETCFDTSFYLKVAKNVQENLLKFLDGASNVINFGEPIKTRKSKNTVSINTIEGFPTLLASSQFNRNIVDELPKSIVPKRKWKWDHMENDKQTATHDDINVIRQDPHKAKCIVSLFGSLDIWTQLRMRQKYEKLNLSTESLESPNSSTKELKLIIESRELPQTSKAIVKYTSRQPFSNKGLDFPLSLGLVPSAPECEIEPAVLSGEWARERCYVCCACGEKSRDPKSLSSHHSTHHPQAQVSHYEIVGEELLNADILKYLYVPPGPPAGLMRRRHRGTRSCTKCNKELVADDLHDHILECAGDTPAPRRKVRQRPFGVRRRRNRMPDKEIRKQLRKNIRNLRKRQQKMRARPRLRTRVGDAETIKKMIADLPAKRHRSSCNPLMTCGGNRRDNRVQILRKRLTTENHSAKSPQRSTKSTDVRAKVTRSQMGPKETKTVNSINKSNKTTILSTKNKVVKMKITRNNVRKSQRFIRENMRNNEVVTKQATQTKLKTDTETKLSDIKEACYKASNSAGTSNSPNKNRSDSNILNLSRSVSGGNNSSNSRRGAANQGNSQSGQNHTHNHNIPKNTVPLKHSIESLTATTHVDAYRNKSLIVIQENLPLDAGAPTYEAYDEQRRIIQGDVYARKLDKPPLHPKFDDPGMKAKLNKPRKKLNDCIAMLKGKLGESPIRNSNENHGHEQADDNSINVDSPSTDQEYSYSSYAITSYQPPLMDYENLSMMPLDLSGKSSYSFSPAEPVSVPLSPIQTSPLCLAPVQSEPLPLVTTPVKSLGSKSVASTVFSPPIQGGVASKFISSPARAVELENDMTSTTRKVTPHSPVLAVVANVTPSYPSLRVDSVSKPSPKAAYTQVSSQAPVQYSKIPARSTEANFIMQPGISVADTKSSPAVQAKPCSVSVPECISAPIMHSKLSAPSQSVSAAFASKKCTENRRRSDASPLKGSQAKSVDKHIQRPVYDPTLKIPQYKIRQGQDNENKEQKTLDVLPEHDKVTETNAGAAILPKEIVEILGTMSIEDRNKLLNALPQVFAKTVKDLKLVVDTEVIFDAKIPKDKENILAQNKSEISTQTTNSTSDEDCPKELLNIDTEKYLIDPITGALKERHLKDSVIADSPLGLLPKPADFIDLTAEEEEQDNKAPNVESPFFPPRPADLAEIDVVPVDISAIIQPLIHPPPLVKSKGSSEKTASLRAVRIKSANEKQRNIIAPDLHSPLTVSKVSETAEVNPNNPIPNMCLTLETIDGAINPESMSSPAIQQAEISSTQQSNIKAAKMSLVNVTSNILRNEIKTSLEKSQNEKEIVEVKETKTAVNKIDPNLSDISEKCKSLINEFPKNNDFRNTDVTADLITQNKTVPNESIQQIVDTIPLKHCLQIDSANQQNVTSQVIEHRKESTVNLISNYNEDDPEDDVSLAVIVKQKLATKKNTNRKNTARKKSAKLAKIQENLGKATNKSKEPPVKRRILETISLSMERTPNLEHSLEQLPVAKKTKKVTVKIISEEHGEIDSPNITAEHIPKLEVRKHSPLPLRRSRRIKSVFVESASQSVPDMDDAEISPAIVENKLPLTKKQRIFSKMLDEKKSQDLKLQDLSHSVNVLNLESFHGEFVLDCENTRIVENTITPEQISHNMNCESYDCNVSCTPESNQLQDIESRKDIQTYINTNEIYVQRHDENIDDIEATSHVSSLILSSSINGCSEIENTDSPYKCVLDRENSNEISSEKTLNIDNIASDDTYNISKDDTIEPILNLSLKKRKSKPKTGKKPPTITENKALNKASESVIAYSDTDDLESRTPKYTNNKENKSGQIEEESRSHNTSDTIDLQSDITCYEAEEFSLIKKNKKSLISNKTKIKDISENLNETAVETIEQYRAVEQNELSKKEQNFSETLSATPDVIVAQNDAKDKREKICLTISKQNMDSKESSMIGVSKKSSEAVSTINELIPINDDFKVSYIDNGQHIVKNKTSKKNKKKYNLKRKIELEQEQTPEYPKYASVESPNNSENSIDICTDFSSHNNFTCDLTFATRRTRSKSMMFKTVTATSPQDFDILGPVFDNVEFKNTNMSSNKGTDSITDKPKVEATNIPIPLKKINKKSKTKKEKRKKTKIFSGMKTPNANADEELISVHQNKMEPSFEIKNDVEFKQLPQKDSADSDDSSKSDVPLKKYVEEVSKKKVKTPMLEISAKEKCKARISPFINDRRKTVATYNTDCTKINEEVHDQTKSDQFMESFGFFCERKPRKSNLLAAKKIFETFHLSGNDSDDFTYRGSERVSRRNVAKDSSKIESVRSNSTSRCQDVSAPSKKKLKGDTKFNFKQSSTYCDICKKQFRRPDNLTRHYFTLLHVSNLSAIEHNLKPIPKDEPPNCLVVYKKRLDNLKKMQLQQLEGGIKYNLPTMNDILDLTLAEKYGKVSGRDLSRDEALFYECCELLKHSHKKEPKVDVEIGQKLQSVSNSSVVLYEKSKPSTNMIPQITMTTSQSSERDEDPITDKDIQTNKEVRNMENNFISDLKKRKTKIFNEETLNLTQNTLTTSGPYDFTSDDENKVDEIRISRYNSEKLLVDGNTNLDKSVDSDDNDTDKKKEDEKLDLLPSTSCGIYHGTDLFEDKFDKIKRKCRSQAAAAKNAPLTLESSYSCKSKKKTEKKSQKRNFKNQQCLVPTKGALKGFDGIKVSIPTSEIKLPNTVPIFSEPPRKKKKKVRSKKCVSLNKPSTHISMPKTNFNTMTPKNKVDVYEFMDDLDDNESLEFRPTSLSERIRNAMKSHSFTDNASVPDKKEWEDSKGSISDGDDFVYMSDDYHCSANETETENSVMSCEITSAGKTFIDIKKTGSKRNDSIEKNAVMGKIFKSNAVRDERRGSSRDTTESADKTNLDQLFDSLLEPSQSIERQEPHRLADSLAHSPSRSPSPSPSPVAAEAAEAGGRQRARRKCTVGKQNVLVETWSSESEAEVGGRRGLAAERRRRRAARAARRAAGEDTRALVEQHGWIVGDSHKKLVTMLAHAKGRKRDDSDSDKRQDLD